jgi:tripartite-type tricarboxylate transporter receptor subunit TctC
MLKKFFKNKYLNKFAPLAVVLMLWLATPYAAAQTYPNRPLRIIVAAASGGPADIGVRGLASELALQLGQQVVVDNRPGASGVIGYETLARAAPDGYTLGFLAFTIATNPGMFAKLPYDSATDFQAIVLTGSTPSLLAVTPALPIRSLKELIEVARAKPGALSFGSAGLGTGTHLSVELLKVMTATNMLHVSYKGIQQAITDVIGGQIHIVCDNPSSMLPHVRSGRLRALGVTSLERSPIAPEVPTFDEAGVAGYELATWGGYALPARAPRDTMLRLNAEINKALVSPPVAKAIAERGGIAIGGTPEQFAAFLRRETEKWTKVIRAAGIKAQ